MATHTEMSRTAANPALVHQMAAFLLSLQDADWTDWELDFLEDMRRYGRAEPLSQRQREVLFDLRDKAQTFPAYQGFSVAHLIAQCWVARADLDEADDSFIVHLRETNPRALRRGALYRLARCARQLGVIETVTD